MKNLTAFTIKTKYKAFTFISLIILMFLSLNGISQNNNTGGQNSESPSPASQSSEYLQNIETDPNGVPNSSVWYVQPWIWAIVAAILILIIGWLYKSYGKRDAESERGL